MPNVIIKVLKRRRGRQKRENQRHSNLRRIWLEVASFENRGKARSQGMKVAPRSWKRQKNGFSSRASKRNTALMTPWF